MRILLFSCLFLIPLLQILSGEDILFVSVQCLEDQKSLLLKLKDSLTFKSTSSTKLVRWNNSDNCCLWDGVGCDSSGHVISLELDNETISGQLENSNSLFNLQYLERLNLAYNNVSSTIPTGLYKLANLKYLNLSSAGFVGQIPIDLARMSRLVTLDLSTRFPVQPLTMEHPNLRTLIQDLKELRELYLDGVNISTQGDEWCNVLSSLSNLSVLSLSNCHLSGPINSNLSELHSLAVINLNSNNLSTTVPDFFANFSNLTTLSLSSCNLQGKFPEKILQVPTLQNLDLSQNNFLVGSLPKFPASGLLRTVVLSYTKFSGSLPDSIGFLRALSKIDLSNCNFSGTIPSTMAKLTQLLYLDFSSNNFSGAIPSFQMSKKIQHIDFSRNHLTGPIPSTYFEGLTSLLSINLGQNHLNGTIPASLFTLPLLQKIQLSNNQFGGQLDEIPDATISKLDTLDLSSNQIKGSIPRSIFEVEKLSVLSLSYNFFNGTVELEMIKRLHNLTTLELSNNNLAIDARSNNSAMSAFPRLSTLKLASCNLQTFPELKNQFNMIHLDLSHNQIAGEIPRWIWKIGNGSLQHLNLSFNHLVHLEKPYTIPQGLLVLDLHSNELQGEFPIPSGTVIYVDYSTNKLNTSIPTDIGKVFLFATFISLSNNSLTGVIPRSICNASYLQVLDLSSNNLSGRMPDCLVENMEALGVLNLGRNNLSGNIPSNFSDSCALKTLDLSRNVLQGKLPISLVNCRFLEVLNIGINKIKDRFPCMLKSSSLRVLVLRSNMFHGDLHCPPTTASWPNLQIIDLAFNNFSGNLSERCFKNWRGMRNDYENGQLTPGHLRFDFLNLSNLYYQDTVTVTFKGLELQLVKILTVFTSIDFSRNKFQGNIPETVGELNALYLLNLSHNTLTGTIPKSIGNLTQLESLDLSANQLSGRIPSEITGLTFLSSLNLSFNQLVGKIPLGRQFQTFTETSFEGNKGLCGFPSNTSCKGNNDALGSPSVSANAETDTGIDWQFIFTGLGFGVGAAVILAPLIVCKEGRDWSDKHLERILLLIFPRYRFCYTRYDEGKVGAVDNSEDELPDDTEDYDEDEFEVEQEAFRGKYCVFCTKLDVHRTRAVHNPKCTCHTSPPAYFSSPTSSSSLLVLYHQYF